MKIEDHNKLVQDLLANLSDQGKVSDILLQFTEDNKKLEENHATMTTQLEETKKYNESLKEANNRVLTQLTSTPASSPTVDKPKEPEVEETIDLDKLIADSGLL